MKNASIAEKNLAAGMAEGKWLFERLMGFITLIMNTNDEISDEELDGLLRVLPSDTANFISAQLHKRHRRSGLAFTKMIGRWMVDLREAKTTGRKIVLVPFNFPPEIIRLFKNAVPMTTEVVTVIGVVVLHGQGERYWNNAMDLGVPDFLCSSSTIEIGSLLSKKDLLPDGIVLAASGACDANSKIYEFTSHHLEIPRFILDKPTDSSKRGEEAYIRYFKRFISELEDFTGEKLDEDHVRSIANNVNEASALFDEFYELHKMQPCPVPNIFSLFCYGTRFTSWGSRDAIEMMKLLVDDSKEKLEKKDYPAKEEIARCLWLYTGYYYDLGSFFNWMEEHGIKYLFDILGLASPQPIDTSSLDTMIEGFARTSLNYAMTRQMGSDSMSQTWIDEMSYVAKDLSANCAVFCGHHACKQTWSIISSVRSEFMKRTGVPVLLLQGDSWMRKMLPMKALQGQMNDFLKSAVLQKRQAPRKRRVQSGK